MRTVSESFIHQLGVPFRVLELFTILRDGWNDTIPLPPGTYQITNVAHIHYREKGTGRYLAKWMGEVERVDPFIDKKFAKKHKFPFELGEPFLLKQGCELPSGDLIPAGEYVVASKPDEYGFAKIEALMVNYPF